ncbi:MAG: DPP IV N-terminal domain-containing protein, partial [Flavitalea sp.]
INLGSKKEQRLTSDGSEVILNGYASWLYMEEILGRDSKYRAFWWSPDSRHISFFRFNDSKVPVFTITDAMKREGYVEKVRYPKVGDPNPEVRIGIVDIAKGKTVWADFDPTEDQYFGAPVWKTGGHLLIQWMNRKQNLLKVFEVDAATGSRKDFYEESSDTWLTLSEKKRFTIYNKGKNLLILSKAEGWNQLYRHDGTGKRMNKVTHGDLMVTTIHGVDEKKGMVFFSGRTKENSTRIQLFSVKLNGTALRQLTPGEYNHYDISLSPGFTSFASSHENVSTPKRLGIARPGKKLILVADSKTQSYKEELGARTTIHLIASTDGKFNLPVRITWPIRMDKGEKYPVLFSVYGGPERNDVMDNFQLTGEQQWFAKEGLIQVAADHRGSTHLGKQGSDFLYHNLGYWEMQDYSAVVKWLVDSAQGDPARVGIKGFSYGGYLSAYALTYGADVFTVGLAGGSVVDWSLYDSHYTERFMGTKADNAEGYKRSSVLSHTDKYTGRLQIVHGMIDENVHLQNSIQLISDLQEKKKDFEFMLYSGSRHGWSGNKGQHFLNLKNKFIYAYLLGKPMPGKLIK